MGNRHLGDRVVQQPDEIRKQYDERAERIAAGKEQRAQSNAATGCVRFLIMTIDERQPDHRYREQDGAKEKCNVVRRRRRQTENHAFCEVR